MFMIDHECGRRSMMDCFRAVSIIDYCRAGSIIEYHRAVSIMGYFRAVATLESIIDIIELGLHFLNLT